MLDPGCREVTIVKLFRSFLFDVSHIFLSIISLIHSSNTMPLIMGRQISNFDYIHRTDMSYMHGGYIFKTWDFY